MNMQSLATYDNSVRINPSEKTFVHPDELESVTGTVMNRRSPIIHKHAKEI